MPQIDPKNLAAQLAYRAAGNPPSTQPHSAISNCFPGLEFDFRAIWRRILVDLVLHEARPEVVAVEDGAPAELRDLIDHLLVSVDGEDLWTARTGPRVPNGPPDSLGFTNLEWANALANVARKGGTQVECVFLNPNTNQTLPVMLTVRPVFAEGRAVLERELAEPGELTQGLCSPWQNDFLECACYYWAASRPDFVNSEVKPDGSTDGHNWLHRNRDQNTPREYSLRGADLLSYEELFQQWESVLKFVIAGEDAE